MATLLELKTRIYEEMNSRTDLEPGVGSLSGALTRAIERAIDFYAAEPFWWNRTIETTVTIGNQDYIDKPSGLHTASLIAIPSLSVNLTEITLEELVDRQALASITGTPVYWAEYDEDFKLYPTPSAAFSVTLVGTEDIGPPATDGESNDWTTFGQDLIAARARHILYRDQFRDNEGAITAFAAEKEALAEQRRNTKQRLKTSLRTNIPVGREWFNINSGYAL